jgi:nickel/cobalt exporter
MNDLLHALQNGSVSLWIFIPSAILLGAMHGLEPGHSKTMMAAFIVAIRGTIGQAVLLGLSAAISHSLIIWILAAAALYYGNQFNAETAEPYLQVGSAVLILGLAGWMFFRTRRELYAAHHHGHDHHDHAHSELFLLDLGHGKLELSVFEEGVPPVFQVRAPAGEKLPAANDVTLATNRPDGARQIFKFVAKNDFLESTADIPEPMNSTRPSPSDTVDRVTLVAWNFARPRITTIMTKTPAAPNSRTRTNAPMRWTSRNVLPGATSPRRKSFSSASPAV